MKTFILLSLCFLMITACTRTVQLITLRGSNVKEEPKGLVLNTDTLTLTYSFFSERGTMNVSIYNKLPVPLYVDWKKSSFIVGTEKLDYWYDIATVNLNGSSYRYYRLSAVGLSGTISKEDQTGFIPPQTRLVKQQFVLMPGKEYLATRGPFRAEKTPKANKKDKKDIIRQYTYQSDNSPLQVRNFLTLSTDSDFRTKFYIDTKFWASEVRVMTWNQFSGPLQLRSEDGERKNPYANPASFYLLLPGDSTVVTASGRQPMR